jgi:SulP family sulfate permease
MSDASANRRRLAAAVQSRWDRVFPIVATLRGYRREDFGHDLLAGVVVAILTIPQAIAYAFLAGLPAEVGLYACMVPLVIYALMGSGREVAVGPVAIAALMVSSAVSEYADAFSGRYATITTALAAEVGALLILLKLLRLSGIVNLLSHPVIVGFVNAAAILIVLSQLESVLGIAPPVPEGLFLDTLYVIGHLAETNAATFGLALLALGVLMFVRALAVPLLRLVFPSVPESHALNRTGPMIATVLSVVLVAFFSLDESYGVTVVGPVPEGLPPLTWPVLELRLWIELLPTAAMIALVAFVETYSIGTTLAARHRRRVNPDQELLALGIANVGAALTGAYPVAGSFARSSVNVSAGARTALSGIICFLIIAATLLWLTPLFHYLPHAVLGVIIITSVLTMVDVSAVRYQWRFNRRDAFINVGTLAAVLVFDVEAGLVIGIFISVALLIHRSSRPHIAVVGRIGTSEHFRNIERYDTETFPHVIAVRIDGSIYFASARHIENFLMQIVAERWELEHLVIVCSPVNFIDSSGLEMLDRVTRNLQSIGISVHLAEVKGPVMDQLEKTDFLRRLSGKVFFTTDQAMRELETQAQNESSTETQP